MPVLSALKRMGSEFLAGYAKLVTGEKDPRNLRVAFTIARVILVEFDISQNTEVGYPASRKRRPQN